MIIQIQQTILIINLKNKKFILNEETVRNIKNEIIPGTRNYSFPEIINSLKIDINDLQIDILPVKVEYKKKNVFEKRDQNIYILGLPAIIKTLNYKKNIQYGIDFTYKIIPKSFKPIKLMTIYNIDKNTNIPDIAALIFIKYNDANSLNKLLFLMRAQYNFSSKFVTTDFDGALIKSFQEYYFL